MPPEAKILIADDHEDTPYTPESTLTRATNGDAALKKAPRGHVGLLLPDVRMPRAGALAVLRHLRRPEQTQHIPVILLTGFGLDTHLTATATASHPGVADIVTKPVDPWIPHTTVRHPHDAHQRYHALEREARQLRAHIQEHAQETPRSRLGAAPVPGADHQAAWPSCPY